MTFLYIYYDIIDKYRRSSLSVECVLDKSSNSLFVCENALENILVWVWFIFFFSHIYWYTSTCITTAIVSRLILIDCVFFLFFRIIIRFVCSAHTQVIFYSVLIIMKLTLIIIIVILFSLVTSLTINSLSLVL